MTIYKFSSFICFFSFSGSVMTIYKFSVIWILPWPYISSQSFMKLRCSEICWRVSFEEVEMFRVRSPTKNVEDATFSDLPLFSFVGRGLYVKALISGSREKLWAVFCQILYMDLGHSGWSIHICYCTCIGIQYKVFSYMGIQYLAMLKGIFKKLSRSATWEFST